MNHYQQLGVPPEASREEIRSAYRCRLRQVHPDLVATASAARQAEATRAAQRVTAAWATLGHPGRRANYDESLRAPSRPLPLAARAPARTAASPPPRGDHEPVAWLLDDDTPGHRRLLVALATLLAAAVLGIGGVVAHSVQGGGPPVAAPAPRQSSLDRSFTDALTGTVTEVTAGRLTADGQLLGVTALRWAVDVRILGGTTVTGTLSLADDDGSPLCTAPVTRVVEGSVSGVCSPPAGRAVLVTLRLPADLAPGFVTGSIAVDRQGASVQG